MDFFLVIVLGILFLLLSLLLFYFYRRSVDFEQRLSQLRFDKNSQSVRYGKTVEQWIPFSNNFPFSRQDFRFIGSPIDGLSFEDDRIIFVEFKAADSKLSEKQKRIKQLVLDKKVEWFELNAK